MTLSSSASSPDPTWDRIPSAIYSLVEVSVGISCASMATLRPLFRRLQQRVKLCKEAEGPRFTMMEHPHSNNHASFSFDREWMTGTTTQARSED